MPEYLETTSDSHLHSSEWVGHVRSELRERGRVRPGRRDALARHGRSSTAAYIKPVGAGTVAGVPDAPARSIAPSFCESRT